MEMERKVEMKMKMEMEMDGAVASLVLDLEGQEAIGFEEDALCTVNNTSA
jgi:hypothetical protein